jgi:hypothetical protein
MAPEQNEALSPILSGSIEAVIKLLSEELRDLISGLPEHLQNSVPKQLKGNPPASNGSGRTPG